MTINPEMQRLSLSLYFHFSLLAFGFTECVACLCVFFTLPLIFFSIFSSSSSFTQHLYSPFSNLHFFSILSLPSLFSFYFFTPSLVFPVVFPLPHSFHSPPAFTFCMVFSGGAMGQRNNSKSLHIAGAVVSGGAPMHWHISLSGLTQQTAYAMTNSPGAAERTWTHTHRLVYEQHTLVCEASGSLRARGAHSFKEISNTPKRRRGEKKQMKAARARGSKDKDKN